MDPVQPPKPQTIHTLDEPWGTDHDLWPRFPTPQLSVGRVPRSWMVATYAKGYTQLCTQEGTSSYSAAWDMTDMSILAHVAQERLGATLDQGKWFYRAFETVAPVAMYVAEAWHGLTWTVRLSFDRGPDVSLGYLKLPTHTLLHAAAKTLRDCRDPRLHQR